jgi:hypothetical protein
MNSDDLNGADKPEGFTDRYPVDVTETRKLMIAMGGLTKADSAYTAYYDETNNIRRLLLTPDGMNNSDLRCFALGGVAHARKEYDFKLDELRKKLKIQPSAPEIKTHHLTKGDFLDAMDSPKVEIFLQWLIAENLYIHCSVVDPLYWSIVDIIDSILMADGNEFLMAGGHNLKSDLYLVLLQDRDHLIEFLHRYSYPNVGSARKQFVEELLDTLEAREDMLEHFNYQMLKDVLKMGKRQSVLEFLEDQPPNVLIDELSGFFINRIFLLKNTQHIFDGEPWIEGILKNQIFLDDGKEIDNFRFVDSVTSPGTQMSDVTVGLLGKYFTYLNRTDWDALETARNSLTERQRKNILCLKVLLEGSIAENPIFFHTVLSITDLQKSEFFLEPEHLWRHGRSPRST